MQEKRYRQRYLDGIANHQYVRNIFHTRAKIVQFVRRYLDDREFLEVSNSNAVSSCLHSAAAQAAFSDFV